MIDIQKQQEFLVELATIDARLNAVNNIISNMQREQLKLQNDRKDILVNCSHVDEEANPAISGGSMFAFCLICGQIIDEAEADALETEIEELKKEK